MYTYPLYYDLPEKAIPLRMERDLVQQSLSIMRVSEGFRCDCAPLKLSLLVDKIVLRNPAQYLASIVTSKPYKMTSYDKLQKMIKFAKRNLIKRTIFLKDLYRYICPWWIL